MTKETSRWRNKLAGKISEFFVSIKQHRGPCKKLCFLWGSAVTQHRADSFRSFVNERNFYRQIAPRRWIRRWRSPEIDAFCSSRKAPTLRMNTLPFAQRIWYLEDRRRIYSKIILYFTRMHCRIQHNSSAHWKHNFWNNLIVPHSLTAIY